jgi:O-antigen/teichoic acid export membrane protein
VKGSISWLLLEKILRVASGVLVSTAVARYLGPGAYGSLAVAIGVVGIAVAAAGMGADHINLAQLSRRPGPEFLASAVAARTVWSVFCAAVVILVVVSISPGQAPLVWWLGGMVLAAAPQVFVHQMYADNAFRVASIVGILAIALAVVARLWGVAEGFSLAWFAGCAVLEPAVMVLAAAAWAWRRGAWRPAAVSLAQMRGYLRLCGPTLVSAVLVALYFRIELLVVDAVLGARAVGTWSAAMMFILPWNMASAAVLPVVNRRLGQSDPGDGTGSRVMVKVVRAMLLLAVGCALLNMLAVQFAVPLLLGPRFAEAAAVATIASLALVPLFLGAAQDVWLAQRQRNAVVLRKVLIGIPMSVALLWFGASQGGLQGAALAMVLSYTLTAIGFNAVLDREFLRIQGAAIGVQGG